MKKTFEVQVNVTYNHHIEVEIPDNREDDYNELCDDIYDNIDIGAYDDPEEIAQEFIDEFGEDDVKFVEDGSGEFEITSD